jgi:VWFA-related protein
MSASKFSRKNLLLPLVVLSISGFLSVSPVATSDETQSPSGRITQFEVFKLPQISFYISVVDQNGKPVTDLSNSEVSVFEDGTPVEVAEITPVLQIEESSLSGIQVVLVIDNSSSMGPHTEKAEFAANLFIDQIRKNDKVAIVDFGRESQREPGRIKENFTNVKFSLKKSARFFDFTAKTYLYDAVYLACSTLEQQRALGAKAVVVLSDGEDNGSKKGFKDVMAQAKRTEQPLYVIDFNNSTWNRAHLKKMALETGGKYFASNKPDQLASIYDAIVEQLQGQYQVSYVTSNHDWAAPQRNVKVVINRGGLSCSFDRNFEPDVARMNFFGLLYKEGLHQIDSGDYLKYLGDFAESEFQDDVKFKLGVYYEERGFYEQALNIYDELARLPVAEWKDEVLFRKGKIFEEQGQYSDAVAAYSEMIEKFPNEKDAAKALLGLARSRLQLSEPDKAESSYRELITKHPGSEVTDEGLLELSELLSQNGRHKEAKALLQELVENYKESNSVVHAYYNLGVMAEAESESEKALEFYAASAQATDDRSLAAKALIKKAELLFTSEKWMPAQETYQAIIETYGESDYKDEAYYGLARTHRETGRLNEMRAAYDQLKAMKARDDEVSFDLHGINAVAKLFPPGESSQAVALSGARLVMPPGAELPFPLEVSIQPRPVSENFKNLPIAGDVYDFSATVNRFAKPIRIALPYDDRWFADGTKQRNALKLYTYENSQWQLIAGSQVDTVNKMVSAEVTGLSLKVIMYESPRIIRFDDILFSFGSTELSPRALTQLDTVLAILNSSRAVRVEVQGHTDSVGTAGYNLELSQKRANKVRDYLVKCGIDSSRALATGFGPQYPIASNGTEEGRAQNRRTEFIIVSKGEHDIIDVLQKQYGTKYTIELGAFSFLSQAAEQREFFKAQGYKTEIKQTARDGGTIYLLWCGFFNNKEEALSLAQEIASRFANVKYSIVER